MSVQTKEMNIRQIFASTPYYIDFYQREYKWNENHVKELLDDIFHRFELDYDSLLDANEENVENNYQWYFMSSLITNNHKGKTYIVDGQQRLTTVTLILIRLVHLVDQFNIPYLRDVLKDRIYGADISGNTFWMGQNGRRNTLEKLLNNDDLSGINTTTEANMVNNFIIISKYLDEKLTDDHKLHSFVIYLLKKVIFVNIHILEPTDVPMVFEVINDRGEKLRPYEVFKGELLGQLNKDDIESIYHPIWVKSIGSLGNKGKEEPDNFFRYYFRSKYVDTEADHRQFDGDYHRTVYSNKWDDKICLKRRPEEIKRFFTEKLTYYTNLYSKLIDKEIYNKPYGEYVFYNQLNEQDRQYMLILSACSVKDPEEEEKIEIVSRLLDRHFVLLQLYGCYDSNTFTEIIMLLNKAIRNQPVTIIKEIFDKQILKDINRILGLDIQDIFNYSLFKDAGVRLGIRFKRYFFARIENFIATGINPNHRLSTALYWDLVRNTGHKTGYHVEHILSNNDENKKLFGNDEEAFQRERNRLGALLLLKGRDNISSGNESYIKKLDTYNNGDISNRWNKTLINSFYHTNKDFYDFMNRYSLSFKPYQVFDGNAVEERQQLLFDMVKLIWA